MDRLRRAAGRRRHAHRGDQRRLRRAARPVHADGASAACCAPGRCASQVGAISVGVVDGEALVRPRLRRGQPGRGRHEPGDDRRGAASSRSRARAEGAPFTASSSRRCSSSARPASGASSRSSRARWAWPSVALGTVQILAGLRTTRRSAPSSRALLAPLGVELRHARRRRRPARGRGGPADLRAATRRKKARLGGARARGAGRWPTTRASRSTRWAARPACARRASPGAHGDDAANNAAAARRASRACRDERRGARFVCALALARPDGHAAPLEVEGDGARPHPRTRRAGRAASATTRSSCSPRRAWPESGPRRSPSSTPTEKARVSHRGRGAARARANGSTEVLAGSRWATWRRRRPAPWTPRLHPQLLRSSRTSTTASRRWPTACSSSPARSTSATCASRCSTTWTSSASAASRSRPRP